MIRARRSILVTMVLLAGALALSLVLLARGSSGSRSSFAGKLGVAQGTESAAETPGLGPNSYEAYLQAERTYPANVIPLSISRRAKATFTKIARADAKRIRQGRGFMGAQSNGHWKLYGPKTYGVQPGVTSFSGATNVTASRITTLVADPDCTSHHCRIWVGASGGGVWETDNALAPDPTWQQLEPERPRPELGRLARARSERPPPQHALPRHGRGQPLLVRVRGRRRCLQVDERRPQLAQARRQVRQQRDVYLHDAERGCVPRPGDQLDRDRPERPAPHLRRLGAGRPRPLACDRQRWPDHPRAGGKPGRPLRVDRRRYDVTEVWDGAAGNSYGVTKVEFAPNDPTTVYVSAFDEGLWRRSPTLDGSLTQFDFHQLFAPQFPAPDRTMFDLTRKNGNTRIYLPTGPRTEAESAGSTRRTSGGRTTATSRLRRCSPRRRPAWHRHRTRRSIRRRTAAGRT